MDKILRLILRLVTTNMYFTKIGSKDAYYTALISKKHQEYLKLAKKIIYVNLPAYLMVVVMVHGIRESLKTILIKIMCR